MRADSEGVRLRPAGIANRGFRLCPRHKDGSKDLVQTAGANNNHGHVVPSKDLVLVRPGDSKKSDKGFEQELVTRVHAAVK